MGIIRLLLALSVDIDHIPVSLFGFQMVSSGIAVETFFMVSGFYMALVLSTKYTGGKGVLIFYVNRFLKILPAYWAVLLCSLALFFVTIKHFDLEALPLFALPFWPFLYSLISQFCLFGIDWSFFMDIQDAHLVFMPDFWHGTKQLISVLIIPQAWSIGLELDFYLIAPFLIRLRTRWLFACVLCSLGVRFILDSRFGWFRDPWSYRFFPNELALFVLGMIAFRVYAHSKQWLGDPARRGLVLAGAVLALVATISYPLSPFKKYEYVGIIFLLLPLLTVFNSRFRLDRYIGELSYPVYILHWFINQWLETEFPAIQGTQWLPALALPAVVLAAMVLNQLLYPWLDNLRRRNSKSLPVAATA